MLTLRQRIFIISGIAMGIVIIIILAIFYIRRPSTEPTGNTNTLNGDIIDSNNPIIISGDNNSSDVVSIPTLTPEEMYTKNLAKIVVERFYTYSNQNNNVHIDELKNLVTDSMFTWMNSQRQTPELSYKGVTTHVIGSDLSEFVDGTAQVLIDVEQTISETAEGQIVEQTVQKSAHVDLLLSGDTWLVNGIWWNDTL